MMTTEFEFIDSPQQHLHEEIFAIAIPVGTKSKEDLLEALAMAGSFPDYFGKNWDALRDCLCDFNWVTQRKIVIAHADLPLRGDDADCRIYLNILRDAVSDWRRIRTQSSFDQSGYIDHELRVQFPLRERSNILSLLSSQ